MPFQNRVDPFGTILAHPARGLFTGNRGIIHDPDSQTLLKRRWSTKAWIICACNYKGRKRDVMGRNGPGTGAGWTNLFFLDEVTALTAGHRPCFFCRYEQAQGFRRLYAEAADRKKATATEIDTRLHAERRASGGSPAPIAIQDLQGLPDGTMIADGANSYALRAGMLLGWSFEGYEVPQPPSVLKTKALTLLTPPTTLAVLRRGYEPVWHASAS
ncbi:hypothetical protein [Oryzicola mucosus]|uniref:Uncharacterized protein n=1 Tax=Oryzicola mucosus TaxID=2767425 RepID=A0A8J6U6I8_9HYPH|nr:hypothetical protein [Oryzicola mucosus]MBD0413067.1 hypothetical protein [Oryzicola mucosus]